MTKSPLVLALLAALAMCSTAQATLIDRSGGMVYDTVLNLTWIRDANYGVTSGITPAGGATWGPANQWAASLNYGGYTGWRLPTTLVPDTGCSGYYGNGINYDRGTGCTGSELGELFYIEGGLTAGQSINSSSILTSHFINMQSVYWSSTPVPSNSNNAYIFITIGNDLIASGTQTAGYIGNGYFSAWAVHPGDIGASTPNPSSVPEPSTLLLLGLGLACVAGARKKLCK